MRKKTVCEFDLVVHKILGGGPDPDRGNLFGDHWVI
jgi:hypothetical protein